MQAKLTVEDGVLTVAGYNGWDYDLTTTQPGGGGDVGGGDTSNTPTLSLGTNNVEVSQTVIDNGDAIEYSLVVENAGTYTFSSNDLLAIIYDSMNMQIGRGQAYLEVGTYKIMVAPFTSTAGMYTLEVEYTAPDTGDSGDTGETEGSMDNPITWTELPSSIETTEDSVYYTYTATADGILSVSWATAVGCGSMYDANGAYAGCDEQTGMYLAVTAGTQYTISLACAEGTDTATATISFQEIEILAVDTYEAPVNTITVTANDIEKGALQYALIITEAGKYTLVCEDFAIMQIRDSVGNLGNPADLEAGLYTVVIVLQYVEVGEYSLTIEYDYPLGSYENPIVWTEVPASVETTEDFTYYTYTPAENGTITFTWASEVGCGNLADASYDTYEYVEDGATMSATLTAGTSYMICLYCSWGSENSTVTITFTPAA